jgi:FkbM family methyltransferase
MTKNMSNDRSIGPSITSRINWLSNINYQADFYQNSNRKKRVDAEYDWAWLERYHKQGYLMFAKLMLSRVLQRLNMRDPSAEFQKWVNNNSGLLWEARELLSDEISKLLFDSMLILRCSGYSQFYFPRTNFEDFVSVVNEEPFLSKELPLDYLGLPLRVFQLELYDRHQISPITVISTILQINLLNKYRQYFIQRASVNFTPVEGDVVLDCGACIGEVSVLIAGLVGIHGEVHLFDPVPLHACYCQMQASLNPLISHVIKVNVMAVGDISRNVTGLRKDSNLISPGGLSVDSYSMTSLDDYVSNEGVQRVNVIKMDIEGAEMAALEGASQVIKEFKPRLLISAYHKPEHLWEIPNKLKTQNADCRLFFGHHSPMQWESVYYAV